MSILFIISLFLLIGYVLLLGWYKNAWLKLKHFKVKPISKQIKVTVIIPARNEEQNIGRCLESIARQTYPANLRRACDRAHSALHYRSPNWGCD